MLGLHNCDVWHTFARHDLKPEGLDFVPGDESHTLVLLIIAKKAEFAEIENCLLIGRADIAAYE